MFHKIENVNFLNRYRKKFESMDKFFNPKMLTRLSEIKGWIRDPGFEKKLSRIRGYKTPDNTESRIRIRNTVINLCEEALRNLHGCASAKGPHRELH
jgi:hypothetical protein